MRHRADAADARHQAGHLVERPAFAEAFEAAHLRDVKVRVLNFALAVELDGDFAVAFKACYGIDGDGLAHGQLRIPSVGAGVDARTTAGLETGVTLRSKAGER